MSVWAMLRSPMMTKLATTPCSPCRRIGVAITGAAQSSRLRPPPGINALQADSWPTACSAALRAAVDELA
jgi:hypothetical protein